MMKTIVKLNFLFIAMVSLASCNTGAQNNSAETILKDSLKRQEIMKTIGNDAQMRMEMMTHMMQINDTAMSNMMMNRMMRNRMMMKRDTIMGKMMMENMMKMMESDSVMCNTMYRMMLGNRHMRGMMGDKRQMMMKERMAICPFHGNIKMGEMKKE